MVSWCSHLVILEPRPCFFIYFKAETQWRCEDYWGEVGGCFSGKWKISHLPISPRGSNFTTAIIFSFSHLLMAFTVSSPAHSCLLFTVVKAEQHSLKTSSRMKGFSSNNCEDSVYYFSFKILPLDSHQLSLLFSFLTCEIVISKLNFWEMKGCLSLHEAITISVSRHNDIS